MDPCFDGDVAELDDAAAGDFEGVESEVVAGEEEAVAADVPCEGLDAGGGFVGEVEVAGGGVVDVDDVAGVPCDEVAAGAEAGEVSEAAGVGEAVGELWHGADVAGLDVVEEVGAFGAVHGEAHDAVVGGEGGGP